MNKVQFISHVLEFSKKENIPLTNIHVSHGGSMLLLDLKDHTNDVDVTLYEADYNRLLEQFGTQCEKDISGGRKLLKVTDVIDVHVAEDDQAWERLLTHPSGVQYRGIHRTIEDYEKLNRPSDQDKLKKLNNPLTAHNLSWYNK